jgi:putative acetyltransferase
MYIRKYNQRDIRDISCLFYDTVHNISSHDYSIQQLNAWAPKIYDDAFWRERFARFHRVFVAEENGAVIGFAEFERNGHVDGVYVHPQHQRRGVGATLMQRLRVEAQKKALPRLFAEVIVAALPFFKEMGFRVKKVQTRRYHSRGFKQYQMVWRSKFRKPVSRN